MLSSAGKLNTGSAPLTSEETIYLPAAQMTDGESLSVIHAWFQPSWIVRTARPVEGLTALMQSALASADPNLPFSGFYDMKDLMAATLATQRVEVAAANGNGIARSIAERGWHLCTGGQHGSPKNAGDWHPHGSGFDDSQGHDRYRQTGSWSVGARIAPRTDPLRGLASRHAQRSLRRRRVRCADHLAGGAGALWSHSSRNSGACPQNYRDRSGHDLARRVGRGRHQNLGGVVKGHDFAAKHSERAPISVPKGTGQPRDGRRTQRLPRDGSRRKDEGRDEPQGCASRGAFGARKPRSCKGSRPLRPLGICCGDVVARSAPRTACPAQESWLRGCCCAHPGTRHRRHDRDIQHRQCRFAAALGHRRPIECRVRAGDVAG